MLFAAIVITAALSAIAMWMLVVECRSPRTVFFYGPADAILDYLRLLEDQGSVETQPGEPT